MFPTIVCHSMQDVNNLLNSKFAIWSIEQYSRGAGPVAHNVWASWIQNNQVCAMKNLNSMWNRWTCTGWTSILNCAGECHLQYSNSGLNNNLYIFRKNPSFSLQLSLKNHAFVSNSLWPTEHLAFVK